jgi:hypothetical protein
VATEHPAPTAVATLCAYHPERHPDELRTLLDLIPTSVRAASEHPLDPAPNGWFLELTSASGLLRDHLAGLIEVVRIRQSEIAEAARLGWEFRLMCYAQVPPHQGLGLAADDMALLGSHGVSLQILVA